MDIKKENFITHLLYLNEKERHKHTFSQIT